MMQTTTVKTIAERELMDKLIEAKALYEDAFAIHGDSVIAAEVADIYIGVPWGLQNTPWIDADVEGRQMWLGIGAADRDGNYTQVELVIRES